MNTITQLLFILFCSCSVLQAQTIDIPDSYFKAILLKATNRNGIAQDLRSRKTAIDLNGDGEIQIAEAENITSLSVAWSEIKSLEGIAYFKNLRELSCHKNKIDSLDLSQLHELGMLNCSSNQLKVLTFGPLNKIRRIYASRNQLQSIDLNGQTHLTTLNCGSNQLKELNLNNCTALVNLSCGGNQLKQLDLSSSPSIQYLFAHYNQLTSINLKNNAKSTFYEFYINNNPDSIRVCVDESDVFNRIIEDSPTAIDSECDTSMTFSPSISQQSIQEFAYKDSLQSKIKTANTINISPNPTTGMVYFSELAKEVFIYNLSGQQLNRSINVHQIDLSFLASANYILFIIDKEGRQKTVKLIKQ